MNKRILLAFICLSFLTSNAQSPHMAWAKRIGDSGVEMGHSVAVDASGNIYTTGRFGGNVDFDPGNGISRLISLGSYDIFLLKLDAQGNFLWAKSFGSAGDDIGYGVAIDSKGNVVLTGDFQGTVDFDPSTGTSFLISNDGTFSAPDIFIAKYDPLGNYIWAKRTGGLIGDWGYGIAVDPSDNVITTGMFYGTADFDPGAGTFNMTSIGSDVFILKLDMDGNFVWAKKLGGKYPEYGKAIACDNSGNIYTTGYFYDTCDFNPDNTIKYNLVAADSAEVFVSKLDKNGNFVWASKLGGKGNDYGYGLALDKDNNVHIIGSFSGTADFDPAISTAYNLTSSGKSDIYIAKLTSSGNFIWAKKMGGESTDEGQKIDVDNAGNVYSTGNFMSLADFDPGISSFNLTSAGQEDIFISKLNSAGNFDWAYRIGGIIYDVGYAIKADNNGNLVISGYFSNKVDFDIDAPVFELTGVGSADLFIEKFSSTAGIGGLLPHHLIKIYPNPCHTSLQIELQNATSKNILVQVFNVLNQKVMEEKLINIFSFNVSQLDVGIYTLKIMNDDNTVIYQKMMKE